MWPLSDRTRRRWTNRLFFLLGVGPLVVVALGCLWLQFGPMATVLAQRWSWKLGADITITEAFEPRPDTLRLTGVTIRSGETGRKLATIAKIEIVRNKDYRPHGVDRNEAPRESRSDSSSSFAMYDLELTAPVIDLSQRAELLRILEQSLRTRCGGKQLSFRWRSPAMTVTYPSSVAIADRQVTVPLLQLHGTYRAGVSGRTTSYTETFFSMDAPNRVTTPTNPEILPEESEVATSSKLSPEFRVRMERRPDDEGVLRTILELETGEAELPSELFAVFGKEFGQFGRTATFRGHIEGRPEGDYLSIRNGRITRFDPSGWLRRLPTTHWMETTGTLDQLNATWQHGQFTQISGVFSAQKGNISGSLIRAAGVALGCLTLYPKPDEPIPDIPFDRLAFSFDLTETGLRLNSVTVRPEMWFSTPTGERFTAILVDRQETPILAPPTAPHQPIPLRNVVQAILPPPPTESEQRVLTAYRGQCESLLRRLPSRPLTTSSQVAANRATNGSDVSPTAW